MPKAPEPHKPFPVQFILERWGDGLKVLGADNGTGFLASIAALQYFSDKPAVLGYVKVGSVFFMIGVITFAFSFYLLALLVMSLERFIATEPPIPHRGFANVAKMLFKKDKEAKMKYIALLLISLISMTCFFGGCQQSLYVVLNFEPRASVEVTLE